MYYNKHVGYNYECAQCYYTTENKTRMAIHNRIHTGEKPYECNVCGAKFSVKHTLTVHTRRHTGEKPYKCELHTCSKTFTTKANMISHYKNNHANNKPHICTVCSKTFSAKSGLARHIITHVRLKTDVTTTKQTCNSTDQ